MSDRDLNLTEKSPLLLPTGAVSEDETTPKEQNQGIIKTFVSDAHAFVGDIVEDFQEAAEHFLEEMQEEIHDVAEHVHEEHHGDDADKQILEMGLTRNLSLLPGDIVDAARPTVHEPLKTTMETIKEVESPCSDKPLPEEPSPRIPISAYIMLLSTPLALSAIGPALQLQKGVSPTMKTYWRMSGIAILLSPLALHDMYRKGAPYMSTAQWITFMMSAACYSITCVAFVLSLNYTSVGNAVVLSNSQSLILLGGKICFGDPVSVMEGVGALIAFSGAAFCSKDSAEGRSVSPVDGLFGDFLAILSALAGVGYLTFAKSSRQVIGNVYVFMFLTMTFGSLMVLAFNTIMLNEHVTFDRDPNHGVFGFSVLQPDRLPLEIAIILFCDFMGTMGYVRAMSHFSTVVISSVTLLEPVAAEFLASAFGVGSLPGVLGWVGNALVALGTFIVVYKESAKASTTSKTIH